MFILFSITEIFLYTKILANKKIYSDRAGILNATLSRAFTPTIAVCVSAIVLTLPSLSNVYLNGANRSDVRAESSYIVIIALYILIPHIIFHYSKKHINYRYIILFSAIFIIFSIFIGFRGLLLTLGITVIFGEMLREKVSFAKKTRAVLFTIIMFFFFIFSITMLRSEAQGSFEYAMLNRLVFTPVAQFQIAESLFFIQDYPGQWIVRQFEEKVFSSGNLTLGRAIYLIQYPESSTGTGSAMIFGDFAAISGKYLLLMVFMICTFMMWAARAALIRRHWMEDNIPILLLQIISIRWFLFGLSAVDVYFVLFCLSLIRARKFNAHN